MGLVPVGLLRRLGADCDTRRGRRARAFEVTARFYEMGSAAALEETERHLAKRR